MMIGGKLSFYKQFQGVNIFNGYKLFFVKMARNWLNKKPLKADIPFFESRNNKEIHFLMWNKFWYKGNF